MSVTFTFATTDRDSGVGDITVCGPDGEDPAALEECFAVNVSNANATEILDRLGLATEGGWLVGDIDPDDLLGRALVANIGRDDSGVAAVDDLSGDGVVTDCGRRPGYFDSRMRALIELAMEARRRGVRVAWM